MKTQLERFTELLIEFELGDFSYSEKLGKSTEITIYNEYSDTCKFLFSEDGKFQRLG